MKSFPKDRPRIRTNCKECVFAIYDGKTQVGCTHNRIEKFKPNIIEAYDDDKEFYVINNLCNFYRNAERGYSVDDVDLVKSESAISYDIIFDCNELDDKKVGYILDFINNNGYNKEKINIILVHSNSAYPTVKHFITDIYKQSKNKPIVSICDDVKIYLGELLFKTNKACHAFVSNFTTDIKDAMISINNYVNEDVDTLMVIDFKGALFVSNSSFKQLNKLEPSSSYDEDIETIIKRAKILELFKIV